MLDLTDVTFTIPIKIDQPDRARNINIITRYLKSHFDTNIIICEMDSESKVKQYIEPSIDYKYVFMKTPSPWIHRTKMLNFMAKLAETPIIVNYDTDVLLRPESYINATNIIRNKYADMVFPYDGNFLNIPPKHITEIKKTLNFDFVKDSDCTNLRPLGDSVGGAVFWCREAFRRFGMENENFISWGFEDTEREYRARTLDLVIKRTEAPLYHLHHNSSPNSASSTHPFYKNNEQEWVKVSKMSKSDITEYMTYWEWLK